MGLPLDQVVLKAPITNPNKVIGIGLNYRDHAEESNLPLPQERLSSVNMLTLSLDRMRIFSLPVGLTDKVDYEAELAVVIGRRAYNISEEECWTI